jgi:hypothetical protein
MVAVDKARRHHLVAAADDRYVRVLAAEFLVSAELNSMVAFPANSIRWTGAATRRSAPIRDVGMRVSYSYAVRDQNRLVYQRDEDFVASLPSELRGPMQRWFERFQLSLDDDIALFEGLYGRYRNNRRVKVQLAPAKSGATDRA